jgi:hypothetical protein
MFLAALGRLFGAAFALRPSFASVARGLGWCEYDYPRWGAHTTESILPRARHTGFYHGSELPRWLRYGAPALRCPALVVVDPADTTLNGPFTGR